MRFSRPLSGALLLLVAAALAGTSAAAQGRVQLPAPVGYVNDFANVIPPAYEDSIQAVIDEVRAKSGGEIVVVTLPSLQGRSRDEVALQIGREWRIGRKGGPTDSLRNTGAVVLVSMQDRTWKIETGTGAMTFITAGEAGRIGRDLMVPQLQAGNPGRGMLLAVAGLAQEYSERYGFQLTGGGPRLPERPPVQDRPRRRSTGGSGIFWIIVFFLVISFLGRRGGGGGRGGRRRRRGWGGPVIIPFPIGGGGWGGGGWGGGGGGGFGGFGGGGGFSGGGAGGDW